MSDSQYRYIALLRAINVGGHSITRMSDLRGLFESSGLTEVVTYIQSGNVLFNSKKTDLKQLVKLLEKKLESSLGYHVTVFVFSPKELEEAAANNPFDPENQDKEQRCHLMFLSNKPDPDHCAALMALEGEEYKFFIKDRVLYFAYPRKFEGSGRRTINFERVLGVTGTARTWKVVNKLIELSR